MSYCKRMWFSKILKIYLDRSSGCWFLWGSHSWLWHSNCRLFTTHRSDVVIACTRLTAVFYIYWDVISVDLEPLRLTWTLIYAGIGSENCYAGIDSLSTRTSLRLMFILSFVHLKLVEQLFRKPLSQCMRHFGSFINKTSWIKWKVCFVLFKTVDDHIRLPKWPGLFRWKMRKIRAAFILNQKETMTSRPTKSAQVQKTNVSRIRASASTNGYPIKSNVVVHRLCTWCPDSR